MNETPLMWFAAEYHLPVTYSCRLPLSSPNSALSHRHLVRPPCA
ncbi:MAG: hypothetical protein ACJ8AG_26720 [Ktedonobacteraceae bacterium]